jgi:hypothetical protein
VHWLTKLTPTPDSFLPSFTKDLEIKAINAVQAKEDLINYLKARAVELKPGGFLNFVARAPSAEVELQYRLMSELVFEFIEEGLISFQEFPSFQAPLWVRDASDYQEALDEMPGVYEVKEQFTYSPAASASDDLLRDPANLSNFAKSAHEARILSSLKEGRGVEAATSTVSQYFARLTRAFEAHSFEGTYYTYIVLQRK